MCEKLWEKVQDTEGGAGKSVSLMKLVERKNTKELGVSVEMRDQQGRALFHDTNSLVY